MAQKASIEDLPTNILALCLNLLDAKDVLKCRKVSATESFTTVALILAVGLPCTSICGRRRYPAAIQYRALCKQHGQWSWSPTGLSAPQLARIRTAMAGMWMDSN